MPLTFFPSLLLDLSVIHSQIVTIAPRENITFYLEPPEGAVGLNTGWDFSQYLISHVTHFLNYNGSYPHSLILVLKLIYDDKFVNPVVLSINPIPEFPQPLTPKHFMMSLSDSKVSTSAKKPIDMKHMHARHPLSRQFKLQIVQQEA